MRISQQFSGIKAVDLVAISPTNVAYLIEVKDYRHPDTERIKPSQLADAIARKVLDTLAALLPARLRSTDANEQAVAAGVLACEDLRIVAHIELPKRHRAVVNPADIRMKLRERLAAIDRHLKVVSTADLAGMHWRVI